MQQRARHSSSNKRCDKRKLAQTDARRTEKTNRTLTAQSRQQKLSRADLVGDGVLEVGEADEARAVHGQGRHGETAVVQVLRHLPRAVTKQINNFAREMLR